MNLLEQTVQLALPLTLIIPGLVGNLLLQLLLGIFHRITFLVGRGLIPLNHFVFFRHNVLL